MRASIKKEFGKAKPRAIVLDDNGNSRRMTARRLRATGFEATELATAEEFDATWAPGMFDVIVADWQLSSDDHGDHVLLRVRERDWDVPFVLTSGKLGEDEERARVLASLLESGGARFVKRGTGGIAKVVEEAQALIERRDLALLKIILGLRASAHAGESIPTTSGSLAVTELLSETVRGPKQSHDAERPVALSISRKRLQGPAA